MLVETTLDTAAGRKETVAMVPLVGREPELARLSALLEQAQQGRGRLALLVGEPGIGKTRLADELTTRASPSTPVVWGRCWEAGGAPAYWPWIQVLRALPVARDPAALTRLIGSAGADLAALLPELADGLGSSPSGEGGAAASGDARFRLFDGVARILARSADAAGLVVVLDDLHAADLPSLLLGRFVARALPTTRLLVVATIRDVEARLVPEAGSLIAEIEREGEILHLRRLGADEIATYVRQVTGRAPDDRFVGALAETTEGNPLFFTEAVRLATVEGTLQAPTSAGLVRLSEGVGTTLRGRLRHVSAETRAVLEVGAVLGREVDLKALRATSGEKAQVLLERLGEAVEAGLLIDLDVASPRYRFSHFLVREALYRDLSAATRARLHAAAAQGLERLYRESAEDHLVEIAHHLLAAGDVVPPREAVDHARRAGERSLRTFAFEEAARWFERALEIVDASLSEDLGLRAELCLRLAEASTCAGRAQAARQASLDAAAAARKLGSPELLARAALALGAEIVAQMVDATLVTLLDEAYRALPETPSALRVRVMARLAAAQQPAPDADVPTALGRRAIAEARTLSDPRALAQVLFSARAAFMPLDDLDERLAIDHDALSLALETDQKVLALRAYQRLVYEHIEQGDLAKARVRLEGYERLSAELRMPRYEFGALLGRAALEGLEGRFPEARAALERAAVLVPTTGDPSAPYALFAAQTGLARAECREAELLPRLEQLRGAYGHLSSALGLAAAFAELMVGARTLEADVLRRLVEASHLDLASDRVAGQTVFADAVATLRDEKLAARFYANLLPWAMRCPAFLSVEGSVSRALGVLAGVLGRPEDARRHFEDALAMNERIGARPWTAQVAADLADQLERRGEPGDETRVRELRARARAIAEELGMPGLAARLGPEPQATRTPARPVAAPSLDGVLRLEGEMWTVSFGDVVFRLKDSRGLQMLSRLLAEPGREIHVLDLSGPIDPEAAASARSDAGPVHDAQARAAYRRRLEALREELAEAERWQDRERAARCRREIEQLAEEVARGVGLGGRDRKAASATERARSNVQRRLTDAIRRIGEHCPTLGDHLARSIRTGTYCSYLGPT